MKSVALHVTAVATGVLRSSILPYFSCFRTKERGSNEMSELQVLPLQWQGHKAQQVSTGRNLDSGSGSVPSPPDGGADL